MRDFTNDLRLVSQRLVEASEYLHITQSRARLSELEVEISRPDLWDDQEAAKKVNAEYSTVKGDIDEYDSLMAQVEDLEVLHELAREIDDATQETEIETGISKVSQSLGVLEMRSLFTGDHDESNAIIQVNAKDGGVDAQDWTQLLMRMFTRWAERRGFEVEIDDISEGAEAGILSAEFTVRGRYAYGLMRSEHGTHRLVRISPFDNQGRRQTSFATVKVTPEMDAPDIDVNETEIRMEVFRASGAGGQHVNKTSSAVRLIHEPTGMVATSQEERSQLQNREKALTRLKAMIVAAREEEHEAEKARIAGKTAMVGWGSQIRSYVLQPYQMVKDVRTEVESGNVASVLDGDLDSFMEGFLRWRRAQAE